MIREYIKTMFASGTGTLLSLITTALLTEFVLGRQRYFTAYLVGVAVSIVYTFVFLSRRVFNITSGHIRKFLFFVAYVSVLVVLQVVLVKYFVGLIGVDWYLPIIATIVLTISLVSFFVYKFIIFR